MRLRAGIVAAIVTIGCGTAEAPPKEAPLTIAAAASLTDAFEAYARVTPAQERFSFAGSDDAAAQIRRGAPVDVFAAADAKLVAELHSEGLVAEPSGFIANELVLAVPMGSEIRDLDDLAGTDADVVVGSEGVPVGDYARDFLGKLAPGDASAILARVRSEEPDVKGIVGKLVTGAADAGFVYASDIRAAAGQLVAIELPSPLAPEITYSAAVVAASDRQAGAREFITGLGAEGGQATLLDAGFTELGGS